MGGGFSASGMRLLERGELEKARRKLFPATMGEARVQKAERAIEAEHRRAAEVVGVELARRAARMQARGVDWESMMGMMKETVVN